MDISRSREHVRFNTPRCVCKIKGVEQIATASRITLIPYKSANRVSQLQIMRDSLKRTIPFQPAYHPNNRGNVIRVCSKHVISSSEWVIKKLGDFPVWQCSQEWMECFSCFAAMSDDDATWPT